jgi:bifunctional non-homologous end joining protein LigD
MNSNNFAKRQGKELSITGDDEWESVQPKLITSREAIEVEGHSILFTNIEKELWKDITKAHLITYYHSIADFLLPY